MSFTQEAEQLNGPPPQSEVSPAPAPAAPSPEESPGPDPNEPSAQSVSRRPAKGFGIIELLNGVLIVAVLASIAIAVGNGAVRRAREAAAMAYLRSWPLAMENFRIVNNRYPASLDELTQGGYLGRMSSGRVQYTFSLSLKVALVPASPARHASAEPPGWWQTALARWQSSGVAWAAGKGGTTGGDADKGHGNEPDRCDEDNPGQGRGGPCDSNGGSFAANGGWEGWATPVGGKGRHFYIDETGTIRYAVDASASGSSPRIP